MNLVEKDKMELESFNNSITSIQLKSNQNEKALEELVKAMASLKLKDEEIEKLKTNMVQNDTQIFTLQEIVKIKEHDVKEAQHSKN